MAGKESAKTKADKGEAVVVVSEQKRLHVTRRTLTITATVLGAILILGAAILTWHALQPKKLTFKLTNGSAINGQVLNQLSPAQQKQLVNTHPDANTNINQAYARALALSATGNQSAALTQIKTVVATNKASYYMYEDEAFIKAANGDYNGAIADMNTAEQVLEKDQSISATDKANAKQAIEKQTSQYKWYLQ